jgi:hypothetical protein
MNESCEMYMSLNGSGSHMLSICFVLLSSGCTQILRGKSL